MGGFDEEPWVEVTPEKIDDERVYLPPPSDARMFDPPCAAVFWGGGFARRGDRWSVRAR